MPPFATHGLSRRNFIKKTALSAGAVLVLSRGIALAQVPGGSGRSGSGSSHTPVMKYVRAYVEQQQEGNHIASDAILLPTDNPLLGECHLKKVHVYVTLTAEPEEWDKTASLSIEVLVTETIHKAICSVTAGVQDLSDVLHVYPTTQPEKELIKHNYLFRRNVIINCGGFEDEYVDPTPEITGENIYQNAYGAVEISDLFNPNNIKIFVQPTIDLYNMGALEATANSYGVIEIL